MTHARHKPPDRPGPTLDVRLAALQAMVDIAAEDAKAIDRACIRIRTRDVRDRAVLMDKARAGDEGALADLRDGFRVTYLVLDGKVMIQDNVLVGSKKVWP